MASLADDGGEPGEDRWVPSLAITVGATIQDQEGLANSFLVDTSLLPIPGTLRGMVDGDDLAVSPFVGGSLELMTPALPIPTRPRLFLGGEILPAFASDRDLALEGDPDCVRDPNPGALCASEGGAKAFSEDTATGQGTRTEAQVDTLVYGASLGVAFPLEVGKRRLRLKPSFGWINYRVDAVGVMVNADCLNDDVCSVPPPPPAPPAPPGFLRQPESLRASDSKRFNGIGPGLEVEMDTGRYGPLGVSLFLGGRAYAILGDRKISFSTTESYNDVIGMQDGVARFEVEVDRWIYRAHLGIRFHWLGSRD